MPGNREEKQLLRRRHFDKNAGQARSRAARRYPTLVRTRRNHIPNSENHFLYKQRATSRLVTSSEFEYKN
jgi:hypothetical protein